MKLTPEMRKALADAESPLMDAASIDPTAPLMRSQDELREWMKGLLRTKIGELVAQTEADIARKAAAQAKRDRKATKRKQLTVKRRT